MYIPTNALYAQNWELKRDKNGIKIHTAKTSSGINIFKAETSYEASIDALINILKDTENAHNWFAQLSKLVLLEETSVYSWYTRSIVEMPWPMDNRDIVANLSISKIENGYVINMKSHPNFMPAQEGYIRMKVADGFWKFEHGEKGETIVTYQFLSNPEGIPNWFVNLFLVENPYSTLSSLREMLKQEKYKSAYLPYLH